MKGSLRREVRKYQNAAGPWGGRQSERDVGSFMEVELEPMRRNGWEHHVGTT